MTATSGCKAWAVGSTGAWPRFRTLIEFWNGKAWRIQRSPNPGRFPRRDLLSGVTATSPTNAWAVGSFTTRAGRSSFLIEHWNGTVWKVQKSPRLDGGQLFGVAATSAKNAWAVGSFITRAGRSNFLIEHWNGTAWKVQKSPSTGGSSVENTLVGVAATSSTNAWAVGSRGYRTLIEHWNGTAWEVQKSPSPGIEPGLSSVAASSAKNAWAVGGITDESSRPIRAVIERWNGTAWKVEKSPRLDGAQLFGVAATSAKNAWAVGSNEFTNHALIEHWNGTTWKVHKSPNPGMSGLASVAASSAKNAWAVGDYSGKQRNLRTLALHWNGTAWSP